MKRTPMRSRSKKKAQRKPETYSALMRRSGGWCEIQPVLTKGMSDMALDIDEVSVLLRASEQCRGEGTDPHELRKKSAQGSLDNLVNLLWSCRVCNSWVENYPLLAHRLGLVVRSGDDNWDALGRKNDNQGETDAA